MACEDSGGGGGGGGGGSAAGGGGGGAGGGPIIVLVHAERNMTIEQLANFALVVSLDIFCTLRDAQRPHDRALL